MAQCFIPAASLLHHSSSVLVSVIGNELASETYHNFCSVKTESSLTWMASSPHSQDEECGEKEG